MTSQNYQASIAAPPAFPFANISSSLQSPPVNPYSLSPPVVFVIGALGSIFMVIGYYQIILKYCSSIMGFLGRPGNGGPAQLTVEDAPVWNSGLDSSIIARIPMKKFDSKDPFSGSECSVCLTEFREGEAVRILPKCGHAFHISCIAMWLQTRCSCPLCRADVMLGFFQLLHFERKDEERARLVIAGMPPRPEIDSRGRCSSFSMYGNSSEAGADRDGNVQRTRSLTHADFAELALEAELSTSQWCRRFLWSRREASDYDGTTEPRPDEAVIIDLGGPSNSKLPHVSNGGEVRD